MSRFPGLEAFVREIKNPDYGIEITKHDFGKIVGC